MLYYKSNKGITLNIKEIKKGVVPYGATKGKDYAKV